MKTLACFSLLVFATLPQPSFGCRPVAGHEYKVPTKGERYAKADIVFSGKVIEMKKASGVKRGSEEHPYTYSLNMKIQKWMKGSGGKELEVFDTTGSDCDSLFGINHIVVAGDPRSYQWLVYVEKYQGRNWIITAEPVK